MSFISYYFHWGESKVTDLEHIQWRGWREEISRVSKDLDPSDTKKEKGTFEMRGRRE